MKKVVMWTNLLFCFVLCQANCFGETLTIHNDKPEKVTSAVLEKDRWYTLTANGEFSNWADKKGGVDPVWCFAKWRCGPKGLAWQQLRINGQGMMEISGQDLPYNSSHTYTIKIKGEGKPLEIYLWDAMSSARDNSGKVTVIITPAGMEDSDPSTEGFSSIEEAWAWFEANFPFEDGGGHWSRALKNEKFKKFYQNLRQTDPTEAHKFADRAKRQYDYYPPDKHIKRVGKATNDYFCHDYAWRDDGYRDKPVSETETPFQKKGKHVEKNDIKKIVKNPKLYGYQFVNFRASLQPGDIVVYYNDEFGVPSHSAVVKSVDSSGVTMLSKEGSNSLFEHKLGYTGDNSNFFQKRFGAKGMQFFRKNDTGVLM